MPGKPITVHIYWQGPFSLNASLERDDLNDTSLYQVYGTYMAYASPTLLYIGRTLRSGPIRIAEHDWVTGTDNKRQISDSGKIELYYGTIKTLDNVNQSMNIIQRSESLLIFAHKPVFNTQDTGKLPEENESELRILNWHDFRNLLPELSTERWSERYWNDESERKLKLVT